ncbi:hypothetical protein LCGC14_1678230, partial [marine sediment metagenome]
TNEWWIISQGNPFIYFDDEATACLVEKYRTIITELLDLIEQKDKRIAVLEGDEPCNIPSCGARKIKDLSDTIHINDGMDE